MNGRAAIFPGSLRSWAIGFGVTTAGALFLAIIGPFGSYLGTTLGERLVFQLACFWLGTIAFGIAVRLIWVTVSRAAIRWSAIVLAAALVNLPFSLVTRAIAVALWPFIARIGAIEWYWQGLVTAEPFVLVLALLFARDASRTVRLSEPRIEPSRGLLGMPPSEVLCLQMEDHYVRVHGPERSHLTLATLSQAMDLVRAIDGIQVHRSWWVARHAVTSAERDGRNLRLRLSNGVAAPVARSAVAAVRAAGLLPTTESMDSPSARPGP